MRAGGVARGATGLLVLGALAGCGSSALLPDGGGAGTGGMGTGAGGGGGRGGAGGAGTGLPVCATTSGSADAGPSSCNTFDITGPWCAPEMFVAGDGGVTLDGGAMEDPAGGAILDGDYDLVRFRTNVTNVFGMSPSRRTIQLSGGATTFELAADIDNTSSDGGVVQSRLNLATHVAGTELTIDSVTCGDFITTGYGYTATGDELVLFNTSFAGVLQNVYTYRRTCRR